MSTNTGCISITTVWKFSVYRTCSWVFIELTPSSYRFVLAAVFCLPTFLSTPLYETLHHPHSYLTPPLPLYTYRTVRYNQLTKFMASSLLIPMAALAKEAFSWMGKEEEKEKPFSSKGRSTVHYAVQYIVRAPMKCCIWAFLVLYVPHCACWCDMVASECVSLQIDGANQASRHVKHIQSSVPSYREDRNTVAILSYLRFTDSLYVLKIFVGEESDEKERTEKTRYIRVPQICTVHSATRYRGFVYIGWTFSCKIYLFFSKYVLLLSLWSLILDADIFIINVHMLNAIEPVTKRVVLVKATKQCFVYMKTTYIVL